MIEIIRDIAVVSIFVVFTAFMCKLSYEVFTMTDEDLEPRKPKQKRTAATA